MGRMQKKKPAEQKKKKTTAGSSAPGGVEAGPAGSAGAKSGTTAGGQKAGKQKFTLPGAKRTSGEQTALMKLLERYFGNWIQFLREVKVELSKVTWPSRKQTLSTTAVVIIFVFVIALFLGAVDFGLTSLVRLIL
mgnify:CR=1 FL=1